MTPREANDVLQGEAARLRRGAGGHGGGSLGALRLAEAIEVVLADQPEPEIYAAAFVRAFHEHSTKADEERAMDAIEEAEALVAVHRRAKVLR